MPGRDITSSSTINISLTDTADNPVTIAGTVTLSGGSYAALGAVGNSGANSWTLTNHGVITGGTNAVGIQLGGAAYTGDVASGTITNDGTIAGYSGISIYNDASSTVVNTGIINGGTGANAVGVFVAGAGQVTNSAAGTISGATGVLLGGAGIPNDVVNYGIILGYSSGVKGGAGGSVTNLSSGTITANAATGIGINMLSSATIVNGGAVYGKATGVNLYGVSTLTNTGTIRAGNTSMDAVHFDTTSSSGASRLIVAPGAAFYGIINGGNGMVELTSAASAGTLSGFTNFAALQFDKGASWTIAGNSSAAGLGTIAIAGFDFDDAIDLTGFVAVSKTFASNTLVLTDAGNAHATLSIQGTFATADFHLASDLGGGTVITAACYRAGTRILTQSGEIPIEQLVIGDPVMTRSGEARAIKWIGRRSYDGRFIVGNRDLLPIRFAANSLAEGVPARDLDVSPKHAMFIDDTLIPAELLVNGASIYRLEDVGSVEYVHIELASHDIIFAEGAASESFVDCDSRGVFHNAADYASHYPGDPGPAWQFCAPRLEAASAALVAIRARLAQRAGLTETYGPVEALQGNIDTCDRLRIAGWVFDATQPEQRIRLEVRYDGELVGHVVADDYRPDLEATGHLGDGRCSFSFIHPIHCEPLSSHVIEIRRAADGAPIPGSPVTLPAASRFNADCRTGLARMIADLAQAAAQPVELDETVNHLMTQIEVLLAARARLEIGGRADVADLRDRWGGLVPSAEVLRAAPELRPQALFVDEHFPAPGVSGGASAALDHMRALMRLGFAVSFAASRDLADAHARVEALTALGIRPLLAPWHGSIEEVLRRNTGRLDLVYLHRAANAAAYGKLVRQYCPRALLVYGVADLHHLRLARQGAVENRPEVVRQAERMRIDELTAARLADVVITHSGAEAALLRTQLPGAAVAVVPWSVKLCAAKNGFAERDGVVFIGQYGHTPNVDAVHWLAQDIVPLVQRQSPDITFRVVGTGMPEALRRLARPGLEMLGHVDAIEKVLGSTRLTIAPLRYGAGLKAKVLDSLSAGVPCIGTPIAYEGMTLPPVLAACIAETPADLAAAIVRLHHDADAHAAVAGAAQRHALVNYSEANVDALMQQALAPALQRWAGVTMAAA